ncbi:DUF2834 domain-containing protein [Streptomyces albus]|uniref:DUF2834 domain-containing protein n=1 Tax=Streptomyces albus TaxID=1888 RepID=UPI0013B47D1E|nr:DUF2834 domain-containing protein [Streptomyces albus]QID39633.1 DUF2834 domain-containing protein [Streptomyces albus]
MTEGRPATWEADAMRLRDVRGEDRALCTLYGLSAIGGCLVMGTLAVAFVVRNAGAGPIGVIGNFLRDATGNLASQFIYADLVLIWALLGAYMTVEARRYGIRHVWAYIVGAPVLALIVSFCLFMYVRQLRIAARRTEHAGPRTALTTSHAPTRGSDDHH